MGELMSSNGVRPSDLKWPTCARVDGEAAAYVCCRCTLLDRHLGARLERGWLLKHCLCVGRATAGLLSSVCNMAGPSTPGHTLEDSRVTYQQSRCLSAGASYRCCTCKAASVHNSARLIKILERLNPGNSRLGGIKCLDV